MTMSNVKKAPRHEVISLRMNEERRALLARYRHVLADQLGRAVSLSEAAFLVIEERAVGLDRVATRHELLQTPTDSLDRIRKHWASHQTLSAPEWDVLAEYVQIATDADHRDPPLLRPVVPSRESYLALLEAFDAVYQQRNEHASPHVWDYFGNLDGYATTERLCDDDADQRHHAVLGQIARRRDRLRPAEAWERPGNIGHCLRTAMRDEGIESARLDQLLAPYWLTLWRLAARGHWMRHSQPARPTGPTDDDGRPRISVPRGLTAGDLTVSFAPSADTEFTTQIDFGSPRRFSDRIRRYPELMEWRAMLEAVSDPSWNGRHCVTAVSDDQLPHTRTLWLTQREVRVDFSEREWTALRDLVRQVCEHPDLQAWLQELQQQYGDQG
jgi:hypothetical protein